MVKQEWFCLLLLCTILLIGIIMFLAMLVRNDYINQSLNICTHLVLQTVLLTLFDVAIHVNDIRIQNEVLVMLQVTCLHQIFHENKLLLIQLVLGRLILIIMVLLSLMVLLSSIQLLVCLKSDVLLNPIPQFLKLLMLQITRG